MRQINKESGTVYLVGAGPGDPELISLKGARLLRQADALVYDRLVHPDLINWAPAKTEKIYVGKAAGRRSMPQESINSLLVGLAKRYQTVVRLKGGDPFVYGRGGEEALALRAEGIAFEVVPGISSTVAVPAYAGIPVTHRGVSRSFSVATGHTALASTAVEWSHYVACDTLVVLMGLRRIAEIVSRLVEFGKSPNCPVAVISRGCTIDQEVVVGTLDDIAERSRHLATPAIIVIGEVVALRHMLQWVPALQSQSSPASVFTEHIYAVSA